MTSVSAAMREGCATHHDGIVRCARQEGRRLRRSAAQADARLRHLQRGRMRNVDVDKVSCESFCDLMAVADIDTPGQTAAAARRLISAHHAV